MVFENEKLIETSTRCRLRQLGFHGHKPVVSDPEDILYLEGFEGYVIL